eukprot:12887023-Prorocentrum_lima.AAC.1
MPLGVEAYRPKFPSWLRQEGHQQVGNGCRYPAQAQHASPKQQGKVNQHVRHEGEVPRMYNIMRQSSAMGEKSC